MNVERHGALREEAKWVFNPVLVLKLNRKWQTCIDFSDLNKACPNDIFPLSRIDLLVDTRVQHEVLSFMDAYFGYNQISMFHVDEEHTTFIWHSLRACCF